MLAGTIVASNYLAMATLLARSFLRHHPDDRFVVLLVDDEPVEVDDDRIDLMRLADLDVDPHELAVMMTIYEVREFATAVKPAFLRALLDRDALACYVDPDIYVYAPFGEVVEPARDVGILLTPHVLHPVPRDGLDVSEQTLNLAGMFNLGFIAVGHDAERFLRWWAERLVTDAVIDLERGLFTDQRWVDWVSILFPHVVCRDPGMNIGWWNAHERSIRLVDDVATVDGAPVRFVHFSGYDQREPDVFSHWQPRPRQSFEPGSPLRVLAERYGAELAASGHLDRRRASYQWDVAADGTPLTPEIRRRWRSELLEELADGHALADIALPPAFGPGHGGFGAWLDAVGGGTTVHPHARRERVVWERRADLRAAFPDVDGTDAEHFRAWLDHEPDARRELGDFRPAWYVPAAPATTPTVHRILDRARRDLRRGVVGGVRSVAARLGRTTATTPERFAFLHVPKSAGTSLTAAVHAALPGRRWAPWIFDPDQFGPYADRELSPELRERTLPSAAALREYDAAIGHYSLPTLLAGFDPSEVVTVLREPRCRLLSHHQYWRNLTDGVRADHDSWDDISATAAELDFGDWLRDARVAYQTDNLVIRMLTPHHPAIRADAFIAAGAVPELVEAGVAALARLGWVDVVERGDATWADLGRRIGATLAPERRNVTVDTVGRPNPPGQLLGPAAASALRARTAVDRALWRWVAERRGVDDPDGLAAVVWSTRVAAALGAD